MSKYEKIPSQKGKEPGHDHSLKHFVCKIGNPAKACSKHLLITKGIVQGNGKAMLQREEGRREENSL